MSVKPQGPAIKRDCVCPRARHEHGTVQAYKRDYCRCSPCRTAASKRTKLRVHLAANGRSDVFAMRDTTGLRRRVGALMLNGWSMTAIADMLDLHSPSFLEMMRVPTIRAKAETARRIIALYDELWNVAAPRATRSQRQAFAKTTNLARARGHVPGLAWDDIDDPSAVPHGLTRAHVINDDVDEIAIERRLAGDNVRLTYHETRHAVLELADRGTAVTAIAERLRISNSRVNAILATREDTAA